MDEYKKRSGKSRKSSACNSGTKRVAHGRTLSTSMLGSQLGVGAYRALVENGLSGVMVSVSGQLDLHFVPFEKLVNQETLVTTVRFVERSSDFHKLARFLETYTNSTSLPTSHVLIGSAVGNAPRGVP